VATAPQEMAVAGDPDGHFILYGQVNGQTVRFLVDTGASGIVLSPADARRVGLDPAGLNYSRAAETANGVGLSAPFTADTLAVGAIRFSDVEMEVNQAPMSVSLLGMTFFRRLESFRMEGGRLYLRWRE
jgi:aspartyl protease family protein